MVRRCHNDPWLTRSFFVDCSDLLGQEMCDSETPTTAAATATVSVQDSDLGGLGGGFKYCLFSPFFGEDSHFDGLKSPSTHILRWASFRKIQMRRMYLGIFPDDRNTCFFCWKAFMYVGYSPYMHLLSWIWDMFHGSPWEASWNLLLLYKAFSDLNFKTPFNKIIKPCRACRCFLPEKRFPCPDRIHVWYIYLHVSLKVTKCK